MTKEIYISSTPHETRLAIVEDEQLVEVHYERENEYSLAGSMYKGKVTRVLPGMRMGGHMGHDRVTVRNLEVMEVDTEDNVLVVKGAVPGPNGGYVVVRRAKR